MLKSIPIRSVRTKVFRLASYRGDEEFLQEIGASEEIIDEMMALLASTGTTDSLKELCDDPFKPKRRLYGTGYAEKTRFSDGSFPVFYSSLEPWTAEAEIQYWFPKRFAGKPTRRRTALYSRFTCDFDGIVKDLRPMQAKWQKLTHDSDYRFCNRLGSEAKTTGLDGLLAPSARCAGGTNVPVFARRAISNPGDHALVAMTYDPSTGKVLLQRGMKTRVIPDEQHKC